MSKYSDYIKPERRMKCRLKNRRIICDKMKDGTYCFTFRRYENGIILRQDIRLTREAVLSMLTMVNAMEAT